MCSRKCKKEREVCGLIEKDEMKRGKIEKMQEVMGSELLVRNKLEGLLIWFLFSVFGQMKENMNEIE